ncbi:MAG: hypothetical protein K0S01_2690 [Herbinix sp.]|jgi:radical SAM-linked protein|nr:hypothetical protein [Herbinix sp.]
MKARIKFQKYSSMKFVGHLDVMRYFQKAFRRANIDSEYTKGFSPHQIMSFAAPLGVGLTSDAEYVDIQLLSSDSPEIMVERMNTALTDGFRIVGFHTLLEQIEHQKTVTAMSLVTASDYLVSLKDGYNISNSIVTQEKFIKAFQQFSEKQEIIIGKKTKKSEKDVDIKQMIRFIAFDANEYEEKRQTTLMDELKDVVATTVTESFSLKTASVADVYENGIKVYMQLDTGSSVNLKPELVMEAFYESLGIPFEKFAWQVHRLEIYTKDDESGKLAALNQVER